MQYSGLSRRTLAICLLCSSAFILASFSLFHFKAYAQPSTKQKQEVSPYLLLVSFSSKKDWNAIDEKWIQISNKIPYDGVTVMLDKVVSSRPPVPFETLVGTCDFIRKTSTKHIWPWVFLNRIAQRAPEERSALSEEEWKYYSRINGMDIYNQSGALGDFKEMFRTALRVAKATGAPGVLIDHELYNDHRLHKLAFLAERIGKPQQDVSKQLKLVGRELAGIVAKEYPNAVLWFISLRPNWTPALIAEGILDEAVATSIPLKVVESGIGLVSRTVADLNEKISDQKSRTENWRAKYGDRFQIGGRIAPTDTPDTRSGFIKSGYEKSSIKSVSDLQPIFTRLFQSYQYVFIYAAKAAEFNPFDPTRSEKYHSVIRDALKLVKK